jgi:thioredoxin 1
MSEHVISTDDQGFERSVLQSDLPVLVDFWAPWCGPCRVVGPIVEQLAGEYAGRVRTVKVNVDDSPEVATRYGVQSIPTISLFQSGKEVKRLVGARPRAELARVVDAVLAALPANTVTAES